MSEVTQLLGAVERGERQAAEDLLPMVYGDLRRLAAHKMAAEPEGHTLQPTALVHEAWLRMAGQEKQHFHGRQHFFATAAEAMRRILVDKARSRLRRKRGGDWQRARLDKVDVAAGTDDERVLLVHEALDKLEAVDSEGAQLIKLRFFGGLTNVEAAEVLGLPERTAKRTWAYARAWLYEEMNHQL